MNSALPEMIAELLRENQSLKDKLDQTEFSVIALETENKELRAALQEARRLAEKHRDDFWCYALNNKELLPWEK